MELSALDIAVFIAFLVVVIAVSLYAARKEEGTEDYFLGGRGFTWWLIGFSLIASNISTEHFVGMAGSGFGSLGLAVASYEWFAAATLVVVAVFLLPVFLRLGIYTMPEFLGYRYGEQARALMAVYMLIMYVAVALASVLYSGALGIETMFGIPLIQGIWFIGLAAGAYTVYGGLKAVVWSDLLQGAALLAGGALVLYLGLEKVGGWSTFMAQNADKMHLIRPASDPDIPWTALIFGMWIPNFFYWGFNQFITQRALGAKSLAEGQYGILLAAFIKLGIPFIIVFPGIIAFQLHGADVANPDQAYPTLIRNLLPVGLRGFMFAALFGAVMSSLDSMLNSASTIFTIDIYKRHLSPAADEKAQLRMGQIVTAALVIIGCLIAPFLADPRFKGIFNYIQMFQGFISPGIVAAFIFGMIFRRAPQAAAVASMLINIPVYGLLLWAFPNMAFLNHMGITFVTCLSAMAVVTSIKPLALPVEFVQRTDLDLTTGPWVRPLSFIVLVATIGLYIYFW